MDEHTRPNPEDLLRQLDHGRDESRGKLRIFLGYAAGVGKTYAMLEAAQQKKAEGIDVVVGLVETHGRPETEKLLSGLEVIPRRTVIYRGIRLQEMDLDAVISRHPAIALVDELAHTNAPGSRHPKRFADVQELLDVGIDVYTTLNIQHLESLKDVVAQITGVVVRETVPDSILDEADEISLVDLPPEDLQVRLREGKVYVPEQAEQAAKKFFRTGNLTALRQVAMRRAADRIDLSMHAYMRGQAIPGPWPAGERLLVSVSSSPLSQRLVRAGRRLADELDARWYAVHVETPQMEQRPEADRNRAVANLRLAEELGAEVVSLRGASAVDTILEYARAQNITKIIVGKPLQPRLKEILRGSFVDQLVRKSGPIDVYVISGKPDDGALALARTRRPQFRAAPYLASLALVAAVTLLCWLLRTRVEPPNLVMIYLSAVVITAIYLGSGPAALSSVIGVLAFDFLFVDPVFTFRVRDTQYLITFAGLLGVGLLVSALLSRVRSQVAFLKNKEHQASTLYALSRSLNSAVSIEAIAEAAVRSLKQVFGCEGVILVPDDGRTGLRSLPAGTKLSQDERAVADWAFAHEREAGYGTKTLSGSRFLFLPLRTTGATHGLLGIDLVALGAPLTLEQSGMLSAVVSLTALAVERSSLARQAGQVRLLKAREELQAALYNSVSHELRTPLTTIVGVLTSLSESRQGIGPELSREIQNDMIGNAREQAGRLTRLVNNLLSISRIESGAVTVKRVPADVHDIISSALAEAGERATHRQIKVSVEDEVPVVKVDFALMAQALGNLIDNALKYSPPATEVEITARSEGREVEISVLDRGPGIPQEEIGHVFEKFYQGAHQSSVPGTGLGLGIARGFVEAHGGRVSVRNRDGGGAEFTITIPLE
jgi:two-component system sensor histidine kinase KdpD